jgi:hypothetical protein
MIILRRSVLSIRRIFAFVFIVGGLIASILNGFISGEVCINCFLNEARITFLVFLFVEIIFVVCGASLLLTENYPPEI